MGENPAEHVTDEARTAARQRQLDRIARRAYTRAYEPRSEADYLDGYPYPYEPGDYA